MARIVNNEKKLAKKAVKVADKANSKVVGDVWNLKDILGNMLYDDFIKKADQNIKIIECVRKELSNNISPSRILEIIKLSEETGVIFSRIASYYSLKSSENTQDEEALAKLSALSMISSDFQIRTLFFELWFLSLDDKVAAKFIESKELAIYKQYLVRIRVFKPYTKSEEIEKILTIKDVTGGDSFSSLYEIFVNSFKFNVDGKRDLTLDQATNYFMSDNSKLREFAYKTVLGRYNQESTLLAEIYKDVVLDWYNESIKIRNYKSPISVRNLGNDVDDKSVEILLNVVRKNSKTFVEYFKLKYELLNRKELNGSKNDKENACKKKNSKDKFKFSRYHIYAPYKKITRTYSYDETKMIVLNTFKRFDVRFYAAAKKIIDERHVHSHPRSSKRGGAFCATVDNKITPYVLLNHTDRLMSVFTMMHELGHGIHSTFSSKQTELLSHTRLPLAETASVFSEVLLMHRLLSETKNKEEKISLLVETMDEHYKSIMRQAYFVIFEEWAHENIKEGVTKQEISNYYRSLLKEQFGEMEIPEEFNVEWTYMPHIYYTPFYCYAYVWGQLLSLSFYAMYIEQGQKFVDKYVEFLSAGSSKSTLDIMLAMGADPRSEAFWQKGFDIVKADLEELKKLILEK